MQNIRKGSHSVNQLHAHLVWSTKYRCEVLKGDIQMRCRDLLRQTCDWGGHLWGIGHGAWSTGNLTDEMIQEYLDHHKEVPNSDQNFILE